MAFDLIIGGAVAALLLVYLAYIDALKSRQRGKVERACRTHLSSAKNTLMRSLSTASLAST